MLTLVVITRASSRDSNLFEALNNLIPRKNETQKDSLCPIPRKRESQDSNPLCAYTVLPKRHLRDHGGEQREVEQNGSRLWALCLFPSEKALCVSICQNGPYLRFLLNKGSAAKTERLKTIGLNDSGI